jgi:hypothetical protein
VLGKNIMTGTIFFICGLIIVIIILITDKIGKYKKEIK